MSLKKSSADNMRRENEAWHAKVRAEREAALAAKRQQDAAARENLMHQGLHPVRLQTLDEEFETLIYRPLDSAFHFMQERSAPSQPLLRVMPAIPKPSTPDDLVPTCSCGGLIVRDDSNIGGEIFTTDVAAVCTACGRRFSDKVIPHLEDPAEWRAQRGSPCRRIGVKGRGACRAASTVAISRAHSGTVDGRSWWAYCEEHSYGRVLRDRGVWWAPLATQLRDVYLSGQATDALEIPITTVAR